MLETLRHPSHLNPDQLATLHAIDTHDFSWVIRRAKKDLQKHGMPVVLSDAEAERALKQYYGIIAIADKGTRYAVSATLDPYWHTHVFDTRGYANFCRDAMGGFVHHIPLDDDDEKGFEDVSGVYLNTVDRLHEMFDSVSSAAFPQRADRDTVICTMHWGDINN